MGQQRGRWLRTWAPTLVICLAIAAVATTVVVLLGGGLGAPVPAPTAGQVDASGRSLFTAEGVAYLKRSREVLIDLSQPPVSATALGLPEDGELVLEPVSTGDTELDYRLQVYGGGEQPGGLAVVARTVTLRTSAGKLVAIEASARDINAFRALLAELVGRSAEFGWPPGEIDRVLGEVAADTAASRPFEFTLGPGDRLGLAVSAEVDCAPNGYCATTWLLQPRGVGG